MGLSIEVGYLADMLENDEEGAQWFRDTFTQLNSFLVAQGLEAHIEPETCAEYSCDMYGYSGLHYLRRIAAHIDLRGHRPVPGSGDPSKDAVVEEYFKLAIEPEPGFLSRMLRRPRRRTFDHLIVHSDAEGYYLPQDFATVLFPPDDLEIPGGMVGSSYRLRDECRRLASALELPLDIGADAEEVWQAVEAQGEGGNQWRRYGIESYCCLRLFEAAEHSIKTGAAIVFC